MAVRHGYGKIAGADALVFAYDTGDTRNSYKGEPTENLLNDTTEFGSWTKARNSGTTPTVTSNTSPNPLGIPNAPMADTLVIPDDGTYPRIQQYFTPTSTNQHTMSVWIRSLSGDCDCFLGIFRNSPWSLPGSTVVSVTSEWQRFYFTMTPPDTTTHVAYIGSHDTAAQKGNTLELWGAQIEDKSHVTPFTAGTRSATQGLLDLTGNSIIDLNTVSFDSNAQMTFDGTDDVVTTTFSATTIPNVTIEAVVYRNQTTGRYEAIVQNNTAGDDALYVYPNGRLGFWPHGASSLVVPTGQYSYVAASYDGTGITYCVNGEFHTNTGTSGDITDWDFLRIGGHSTTDSERWIGEVPVAKVYNRALTAAELKNNYRHYKTRFGI